MERYEIINWLLEGDVAIQYQTHRDLLKSDGKVLERLRGSISKEGWGREVLSRYNNKGYWGLGFYQPKWTSTHYTLLDLRNLCILATDEINYALEYIVKNYKDVDGGINPSGSVGKSDVCINGMFLNYACYFGIDEKAVKSVVDFIINQQMKDGAFNCRLNRTGAKHSSMHTTICTLEGIREYIDRGYSYRAEELIKIEKEAQQFLLQHKLFKSDHTGEIIHLSMIKLSYPTYWKYDILRSLDYFRKAKVSYDNRLEDAINILISKRIRDGRWKVAAPHTGAIHFSMEQAGKVSRWNTLRAMRVLEYWENFFNVD